MSIFRSPKFNTSTPSPNHKGFLTHSASATPKLPKINRFSLDTNRVNPIKTHSQKHSTDLSPKKSKICLQPFKHHKSYSSTNTPLKHSKQPPLVNLLSDPSRQSLNQIVSSIKEKKPKSQKNRLKQHQFNTFQQMKFIRSLPPLDPKYIDSRLIYLPKTVPFANTVIFDLDQTLVHCHQYPPAAQSRIKIKLPNGESLRLGLNIRPGTSQLLQQTSRHSQVVVFTASSKLYADAVLDILDPQHEFIHHRLYRDNCVHINGVFIKDLRLLANRNLSQISIVDNLVCSFAYQLDNGIPIISWYDDMQDRELFKLSIYLTSLVGKQDVRLIHRKFFALNRFYEDYLNSYVRPQKQLDMELEAVRRITLQPADLQADPITPSQWQQLQQKLQQIKQAQQTAKKVDFSQFSKEKLVQCLKQHHKKSKEKLTQYRANLDQLEAELADSRQQILDVIDQNLLLEEELENMREAKANVKMDFHTESAHKQDILKDLQQYQHNQKLLQAELNLLEDQLEDSNQKISLLNSNIEAIDKQLHKAKFQKENAETDLQKALGQIKSLKTVIARMEEENARYTDKKELWDSLNLEAIQEATNSLAMTSLQIDRIAQMKPNVRVVLRQIFNQGFQQQLQNLQQEKEDLETNNKKQRHELSNVWTLINIWSGKLKKVKELADIHPVHNSIMAKIDQLQNEITLDEAQKVSKEVIQKNARISMNLAEQRTGSPLVPIKEEVVESPRQLIPEIEAKIEQLQEALNQKSIDKDLLTFMQNQASSIEDLLSSEGYKPDLI